MKPEAARRIAARRNQRARDEMPLFAEQLGEITAEQVAEAHERHKQRFQQKLDELQAHGDSWRAKVAERVSAADLACLDSRRLNLPRSAEYHADFWRSRFLELVNRTHCEKS